MRSINLFCSVAALAGLEIIGLWVGNESVGDHSWIFRTLVVGENKEEIQRERSRFHRANDMNLVLRNDVR